MQLGSHVLRNGEGDSHLVHDEIDVPQALRGDVEEHDEIEDVIVCEVLREQSVNLSDKNVT